MGVFVGKHGIILLKKNIGNLFSIVLLLPGVVGLQEVQRLFL